MPAIYHVKVVDDSFDGAVQHIIEAKPNDAVVWHCEEADANFDGAIFHVKWAAANFDGPVWRVLGIARAITVVLKGTSPLSLPDAIADSLSYVKAFGGTEQGLPDGYTQLEYLQSDATQELRLPFLRRSGHTYKAEFDWEPTAYVNSAGIFSFGADYLGYQISTYSSGGGGIGFSSSNYIASSGRTQMTATMSSDGLNITLTNGTTTITHTRTSANYGYNPSIFAAWTNTRGSVKIYRFKFYEDDVLLFDLIPATYNGINSMYNKFDGSFLSVYAGTLTAGPTAVPTPDAPMDIVSNNGVLVFRDTELPVAYRRILGMTMNNDCFYQTTTYPTSADTLKFSYEWTSETACNVLGCYTTSSAQDNISLYIGSNPSVKYLRYDGGTASSYSLANKRYDVQITPTGSIGMEIEDTWEQKTFTCSVPLCIGITGATATSAKFIGNLYGNVEIVGVTKFIPCKRVSDGEIGYYDTANETFITPTGTTPTSLGYDYSHYAVIADGTVETIEDTIGNTATAEMLLKVGDYQDVQSILDGVVTRKVEVRVFDGTETGWVRGANSIYIDGLFNDAIGYSADNPAITCSHFQGFPPSTTVSSMPDLSAKLGASNQPKRIYFVYDTMTTVAQFQQWLADQYAAGTPVIVIYPLATPTTESVAGQTLQVTDGDNTLEITQASLSNLELEAQYQAAVSLTIQEVQDANLDPNVEVTIN